MPFQPIPWTKPLTIPAAVAPPLVYLIALTLLPPFNHVSPSTRRAICLLRSGLAIAAACLFANLPLRYHVPWSCGLTYILSLVGWYGCTRVIDVFFITGRHRIPRRVRRKLKPADDGTDTDTDTDTDIDTKQTKPVVQALPEADGQLDRKRRASVNSSKSKLKTRRPSLLAKLATEGRLELQDIKEAIVNNNPIARRREGSIHVEKARTDPHEDMRPNWPARILYAIDLETSMRGVGWSWTTADVRHSKKTWLPTLEDEFYQLFLSDIPTVTLSLALERWIYTRSDPRIGIDSLNVIQRACLTLSQGVFLFGTFSAGYTSGAILTSPLRRRYREWTSHNLAFWPPLNSQPLTQVVTVRQFWSRSWHRLFSRLFLVWGVWPGQWLEAHLVPSHIRRRHDPTLDVGKVLGAFFISGIVHAAAGIAINGGHPSKTFEWLFFWCSGIAIVVEECVKKSARSLRGDDKQRWYDGWIGRAWTLSVLLWSGQYFTRGWYDSGLIEEMVTLPIKTIALGIDYAIAALGWLRSFVGQFEAL